jgi:hypothetical protein
VTPGQRAEDHAAIGWIREQVEAGLLAVRFAETLLMVQTTEGTGAWTAGGLRAVSYWNST